MELILLESVEGLGRPGDQVRVKAGYGRNFLLPAGKAVPLSANALRGLEKLKAKAEAEERQMLSTMEDLSRKIAGAKIEISARSTEEGHLFGSVTDKDVFHALTAAGWQLPSRAVRLPSHIKEAGSSVVTLHLHGTITADVTVEVVPLDAEGNRLEVRAAEPQAETPADDATGNADEGDES
ncbi:MAG: 50S ribosomal protein L9 [Planctomycetota bacterium]